MVCVMLVPTGIGCKIGGHAGDATPAARLLAEVCDLLIVHPNVVNASDICELTPNMLYVEGSILDRFLIGDIGLKRTVSNRILCVANGPITPTTANAVSAAQMTLGADVQLLDLETPLTMRAEFKADGTAGGTVEGLWELAQQLESCKFDALAIHSPIDCADGKQYFSEGGVNPWGGVEAIVSRAIARIVDRPVAHAPIENEMDQEFLDIGTNTVVDPRMAAEALSIAYLHCCLKGLHRAPRICHDGTGIEYPTHMVVPAGCVGPGHEAFAGQIIAVRENTTVLNTDELPGTITVDNYLEAAGLLLAYRAGVTKESVRV